MKNSLLLFDLDGTLIDSRKDLAAGINHTRRHYGLSELSLETVSGYVGDGVRKLVERSFQDSDVNTDEALAVNKAYYYSHLSVHTRLYDGVASGLEQLKKAGYRLAVLTNKPGDPSREILTHFNLISLFDCVIGGGDIEHLKPDPEGVYHCVEAAESTLGQSWMIGDHCTDLKVAKNAGIQSAFMRYGFGEERGLKPTEYFASFQELVRYFV